MSWPSLNASNTIFPFHWAKARWRPRAGYPFLRWRDSLGLQLLLLTLAAVVLAITGALLANLSLQYRHLVDNTQQSAERVSNLLSITIESSMLAGNPNTVDQMLEALAGAPGAEHICIFDHRGATLASTVPGKQGQVFQLTDPTCASCHTNAASPAASPPVSKVIGGKLFYAKAIAGQSACYACHDPNQDILGVMLTETTLIQSQTGFRTRLLMPAALFLGTLLFLVAVLGPAVRRAIIRPVITLMHAAAEIGAGNLSTPVAHTGAGELGALAAALDTMREQLRMAQRAVEQRNAELQMLNEVARRASEILDPQQVLELSGDLVVDTPNVSACAIFLADPDCGRLSPSVTRGMSDQQCIHLASQQQSILRIRNSPALLAGRAIYMPEAPPTPQSPALISPDHTACSWVSVPLSARGHELGRLMLVMKPGHLVTDVGLDVFRQMGAEIGLAVANAIEHRRAFFVGAREERRRLASEMHDSLSQTLGYLKLKANLTDQMLAKGDISNARTHLREVKELAGSTYADVRDNIQSLRHFGAGSGDFLDDLRAYLESLSAQYGLQVGLVRDPGPRPAFSPQTGLQVTRILQEALANVRKHAGVTQATIQICRTEGAWQITVEDGGNGFDLASLSGGGPTRFGLEIMRERAKDIGARLDLQTSPGQGTRVTLRVPSSADCR